MKFRTYLKDRIVYLLLYLFLLLSSTFLLLSLRYGSFLSVYIPTLIFLTGVILFCYDFFRKKKFYDEIMSLLQSLDQKYLLSELISSPSFYEGKILANALYESNKSMLEKINTYRFAEEELKDYIELWVHEIKTPVASSKLLVENYPTKEMDSVGEEIDRIEQYIEQVLYYARSEHAEKDYLIKQVSLDKVVSDVIRRNKKICIEKKIKVELDHLKETVHTDSKWLEFILTQIMSNSIRYVPKKNPQIKIFTEIVDKKVVLSIEDNGVGISESDLPRVFEKGFTGKNGRTFYSTTGIGLYLTKKLIEKLGHDIEIKSEQGIYTRVSIYFSRSSFTSFLSD